MLRKVTCCAERILDARSNQLQEMGTAISHAQNKTASCFVHNNRMVDNFRCFLLLLLLLLLLFSNYKTACEVFDGQVYYGERIAFQYGTKLQTI